MIFALRVVVTKVHSSMGADSECWHIPDRSERDHRPQTMLITQVLCHLRTNTCVFLKTVGVVSTSKVSLCTHCGNFPASVIESIILCKPLYVFGNYGKLSFCVVAEPVILYLLVRSMSFRKRCDQT